MTENQKNPVYSTPIVGTLTVVQPTEANQGLQLVFLSDGFVRWHPVDPPEPVKPTESFPAPEPVVNGAAMNV